MCICVHVEGVHVCRGHRSTLYVFLSHSSPGSALSHHSVTTDAHCTTMPRICMSVRYLNSGPSCLCGKHSHRPSYLPSPELWGSLRVDTAISGTRKAARHAAGKRVILHSWRFLRRVIEGGSFGASCKVSLPLIGRDGEGGSKTAEGAA